MAVKIRLSRHGRKGYAFYYIVVADVKAPRDGKFIERIGSYNPNTNPATVDLDAAKALTWLANGAQPTDTVRSIFSREGIMLQKHLNEGVKKGAFDQATADARLAAWKEEKAKKLNAIKDKSDADAKATAKARLDAEVKVATDRAEAIAKKKAEAEAAKAAEAAAKAAEAEAPAAEVPAAE